MKIKPGERSRFSPGKNEVKNENCAFPFPGNMVRNKVEIRGGKKGKERGKREWEGREERNNIKSN